MTSPPDWRPVSRPTRTIINLARGDPMRLVDQVGNEPAFVVENERIGGAVRVRTAADFRLRLQATPHRFILDQSATAFCTEFSVLEAAMLGDSMDILRFPAHRFWIEWMERPRVDTLASLRPGLFPQRAGVASQTRAGALVEINPDERSGRAWLFTGGDASADLCPLFLDFDTRGAVQVDAKPRLSRFKFACKEFPELDQVTRHCTINVEPSWLDYCRAATDGDDQFNREIANTASKILFDWPMIAAFSLLYPLPKPFVRRGSDLARLNLARERRGLSPLLDHVEVTASLGARGTSGEIGGGTGSGAVRGKRLHHVRGHLVRRGDRVFWRSPHLRGKPELGEVMTRTVRVTA